jgi:hypothetical protein
MNAKTLMLAAALTLTAAPIAFPGTAFAASHARDTFIREQDQNGDGVVSKEEFADGRAKQFATIDADRNGVLSEAEYVGEYTGRLTKQLAASTMTPADKEEERVRELRQAHVRFGVLDSDKSGGITQAEFAYSGWRMFTTHDTNKDGVVSAADPIPADKD